MINDYCIDYFKNVFVKDFCPDLNLDFSITPTLIFEEDNIMLTKVPSEEEIWLIIKRMNINFVAYSNGFTSKFFQESCGIIKGDLVNNVVDFFLGNPYPKLFTSICIALLPKNYVISFWNDFHPVSLRYFFNKLNANFLIGWMVGFT